MRGGGTCLNAPGAYFEGIKSLFTLVFIRSLNRHSEQCEESLSKTLLSYKDSSVTSFLHNDVKRVALTLTVFFSSHPTCQCKTAFTLAEVLVTLGIIGVVSAMTVPSLMQNYQRQSYVTQLHKVYNEFSQAIMHYQNDKNALNLKEAGMSSQDAVDSFIKSYFSVVNECDNMSNCFSTEYKSMKGNVIANFDSEAFKAFVIAGGASLRPVYSPIGEKLINIAIDINGQKGPNIVGRDLFWIFVYNNGLLDDANMTADVNAPLTKEFRENSFETSCKTGADVSGCFGKILNDNWQMTY